MGVKKAVPPPEDKQKPIPPMAPPSRYRRAYIEVPRKNGKTRMQAEAAYERMVAEPRPPTTEYYPTGEAGKGQPVCPEGNYWVVCDSGGGRCDVYRTELKDEAEYVAKEIARDFGGVSVALCKVIEFWDKKSDR